MTTAPSLSPIETLQTGIAPLDRILGGGVPRHSLLVIAGEPGAGKSILTLQMLFHWARAGKKVLYFTTLSEPAIKLIRYTQMFSFFDLSLLDERFDFVDLGSALREQGPERAMAEIVARVEQEEPDIVAVDSFKAIHDLFPTAAQSRTFVYDLAVHLASWGATTFLVGEYIPAEISVLPEFAIADGIIRLSNMRQELTAVRGIEVLKLRGAAYSEGQHFFEIGRHGLQVYPRVRAPDAGEVAAIVATEPVLTGVTGLDELLGGGLPRASVTMVEGGTGTGKTMLSQRFALTGAEQGEPAVLFLFEETPEQVRRLTRGFGWDLAAQEARGLLRMEYTAPVEVNTDRFLDRAIQTVASMGARRVVLDSLTSLAISIPSDRRYKELVYALSKHMQILGATLVLTVEVPELLGSGQLTGHGVSSIADNVIMLRYVEMGGHLTRAISVIKERGVAHSTELRQVSVDADGLRVGPGFRQLRGVLTGLPVSMEREP
ncbi:MAG: ATPase domain-containing protein [Chloroflexota bacterium]